MTDPALETFARLFGPEFGHGKRFDLTPLRDALAALSSPQDKLAPVVHVAGTNGKGSTIAFMRAIAEAAGLRVHAFTKPHLFRLNERFTVASDTLNDEALIAAAERVASVAPDLSQFDAQVAAACLLFSETPADLTLIETGMGGRDDATNVIARPALSLITPIGLDHQDVLGATLTEIAAHKAGVLKGGVPAFIARQLDDAREVIEAAAERFGAPLLRQGVEWDVFASNGRMVVQTDDRVLDLALPALVGAHQVDNAGLAAVAMIELGEIGDDAFSEGVRSTRWPGRLQPLTRGPFSAPIRASGGEVWVDAGHNAHGAAALANALDAMRRKRDAPTIAVVGMLARKDCGGFIGALASAVDQLIAVPLSAAHIAPALIAAQGEAMGVRSLAAPSLDAAMQIAAQLPAPRLLICGSFALAAEALGAEGA